MPLSVFGLYTNMLLYHRNIHNSSFLNKEPVYYVPLRTSVVYNVHPCMCHGAMYNFIYSCRAACMSTNTRIERLMSHVVSIDLFWFEDAQLCRKFKESNIAYLNNASHSCCNCAWLVLTCQSRQNILWQFPFIIFTFGAFVYSVV